MAIEDQGKVDLSYIAAEDLSSSQYKFVKLDTAGKVAACTARGEKSIGILQNKPKSGEVAQVRVAGVSKVQADAAIDEGDFLTTSADAQASVVAAAASGTSHVNTSDAGVATDPVIGSYVLGLCVFPAGAAGRLGSILITHAGAVATTAS